jgi:hypothetical protein
MTQDSETDDTVLKPIGEQLSNEVEIEPREAFGPIRPRTGVGSVQEVGGNTSTPTASFTRPSNTTAYTAGQVVADSTTAATVRQFSNCSRTNGNTGLIVTCVITDSAKQTTLPQFNLWLFNASPTVQNDAAAFAPSATDLLNLVAILPVSAFYGASANGALVANGLNQPFKCASGSTTLYGVLVAANAYTPVSAEVFNITLGILQD